MRQVEQQIIELFNSKGDSFVEETITDDNFLWQAIARELKYSTPNQIRILDIGSGKGKFVEKLRQTGFQVVGAEPAQNLLEISRNLYPNSQFTQGSATNLPFPDASFDVVLCIEVLEHIPGTQQTISEMYRVLKPAGKAIIIDKNIISLHYLYFIPTWFWKTIKENTNQWMYPAIFPFREKYFMPTQLKRRLAQYFSLVTARGILFEPVQRHRQGWHRVFWRLHWWLSHSLHQVAPNWDFYYLWTAVKPTSAEMPPIVRRSFDLALNWLLRAHTKAKHRGFSASFSLKHGWGNPYPETTGYIIPTLLNCLTINGVDSHQIKQVCSRSANWLVDIQYPTGAIPGYDSSNPVVFDTGQVILGWLAMLEYHSDDRYLSSVVKAGDWLINQQESDGSWQRFSYNQIPHTYHALVDYTLIKLYHATGDIKYKTAAINNLDWVLRQRNSNGWFNWFGFLNDNRANLHTIAYTLQGLLWSGEALSRGDLILAATETADRLLKLFMDNKLNGGYDSNWQRQGKYQCLTGLVQLGLVWDKLFDLTKETRYSIASRSVWLQITQLQNRSWWPDLLGAIPGSNPIWGEYLPWVFPNWAVKFYIDLCLNIFV